MKVGSLFSGIGGFDLGFERAGFEIDWQVEIDPKCRQLLSVKFDSEVFEDVREFEGRPVDVIVGGFPCQDLSVAGRRAGLAGERSGLFYELMRVIRESRPKVFVLENVPGLLSSNGGRDMAAVTRGMEESGYWWAYRVLDAQYFGLAQRRKRVFIVGCSSARRAAEILLEPEGLPRDTPPSREKGQEVTECAGTLAANGGGTNRPAGNANELDFCVMPTLRSGDYSQASHGARSGDSKDEYIVAHPVQPGMEGWSGADHETYIPWHENKEGNLSEGETARALRSGASHSYQGVGVRRLTPLECERLQGFPDGWTDGFADSVRYRMLGNAVAVPVAEWIAKRIKRLDFSADDMEY